MPLAQGAPHQDRHSLYRHPHTPYPLDQRAYRRRNQIERLFCRLKNWRRLATRYDRLAQNFLAALALIANLCSRHGLINRLQQNLHMHTLQGT